MIAAVLNDLKVHPWKRAALVVVILGLVFLRAPLTAHIRHQRELVEEQSKYYTIEYNRPYVPYFAAIAARQAAPEGSLMGGYHFGQAYTFDTYYQMAADLFPNNDAALALRAFCAYYQGDKVRARVLYQRALRLNPGFWWYSYNLGVIAFKEGEVDQALLYFDQALSTRQEGTLATLQDNYFYRSIWQYCKDPASVVMNNLKQGLQEVLAMRQICAGVKQGTKDAQNLLSSMELMKKQAGLRFF